MGGPRDDVAANIRAEQNADARPTKEEAEAMHKRAEEEHAEWKALEAAIERIDGASTRGEVVVTLAKALGFTRIASKSPSDFRRSTHSAGFAVTHLEAHEKPNPDDFEGQMPSAAYNPAFPVTDRVRELKREAFAQLQEIDLDEVRIATKILNPYGASLAVAVYYDGELTTNEYFDKCARMGESEYYRDRFDEETIEQYEGYMDELVDEVTP